jgi:hypothetical protein
VPFEVLSQQGRGGQGLEGPIVTWVDNADKRVDPPADAHEWEQIIIDSVGRPLWVEFVSRGQGGWWIARAEQLRVNVGGSARRSRQIIESS